MMRLTKEEVLNFPPETYESPLLVIQAVSAKFACGIDSVVARRIIDDYKKKEQPNDSTRSR